MNLKCIAYLLPVVLLAGCGRTKEHGPVTTTHQQLTGITNISLQGFGTLELMQADEESLDIKTTKDALEHIETTTQRSHLTIKVDEEKIAKPHPEITFRVNVKNIDSVNCAGFFSALLQVHRADKLRMNLTGSIDASIRLNGSELDLGLSGATQAKITGEVSKQTINITGSSSYDALQLKSAECAIEASGAVEAKLNCSKKIEGTVSGSSALSYAGKPAMQVQAYGASTIKALD